MQDPQKLQEENERLKAELATYKDAEKAQKQKRSRFIKRLGSWGSWFFLGGDLKQSIKKLVVEVRDTDKELSSDTLGDVLAHGAWRFTRIGCFAIFIAIIPFFILSVQTMLLYYQNNKIDIQNHLVRKQNQKIDDQNIRLDQQTNLQEAERRSSLVFLFSNVMDAIDRELKDSNNKERKLSKQLIGRIIALSASLKPYRYLTEQDALIVKPLSPERGQLLVNLLESDLDSVTYIKLFAKANFEAADLIQANLRGLNLMKVNLNGADLSWADLSGATLRKANLGWERLSLMKLNVTNLIGKHLDWDDFFGANLMKANLHKADLREANLRNADLRNANLNGANLTEAYLGEVDLRNANLRNANLTEANLRGADLSNANLRNANLTEADLREAKTNSKDFLTELDQNIFGNKELQKKYYVASVLVKDIGGYHYLIKEKPTQD